VSLISHHHRVKTNLTAHRVTQKTNGDLMIAKRTRFGKQEKLAVAPPARISKPKPHSFLLPGNSRDEKFPGAAGWAKRRDCVVMPPILLL
jgi:hypothetical protein